MSVRDAGLIAIGAVLGVTIVGGWLTWAAEDIERVDRIARALALKYRGPRVQGEG